MESLFITGGSGFVGRSVLRALDLGRYRSVYCLSRGQRPVHEESPAPANLTAIAADLCEPERYRPYLEGCGTVLHLAAAAGKARPSEFHRVNALGTKMLLDECQRAGVRKFLFASSIAVKFPENRYYPYARSKQQGEALVRDSRLPFIILRPTVIVGQGSPVLSGLARLAALPVMPVFGSGRAMIQPLFVADLARAIRAIVDEGVFRDEILEIGGPQALSIEDFMKRIRGQLGKKAGAVLHIPLRPLLPLLAAGEKFMSRLLPLSAGQLYSFRYDGLADAHPLAARLAANFLGVERMLKESSPHA